MMKQTEDDTMKWKDTLCSWIARINIVKMTIHPKEVLDLMQFLWKYPWLFFLINLEQNYPKIHMESQKMPICQSDHQGKKAGNILSELELYYKAIVIKTAWYWHKNTDKSVEQNG